MRTRPRWRGCAKAHALPPTTPRRDHDACPRHNGDDVAAPNNGLTDSDRAASALRPTTPGAFRRFPLRRRPAAQRAPEPHAPQRASTSYTLTFDVPSRDAPEPRSARNGLPHPAPESARQASGSARTASDAQETLPDRALGHTRRAPMHDPHEPKPHFSPSEARRDRFGSPTGASEAPRAPRKHRPPQHYGVILRRRRG